MAIREPIVACECWARDGLQSMPVLVSTEHKAEMIERGVRAGFPKVEVTSFSHPKLLPQFADAAEVLRRLERRPGTSYVVLMPNTKGFDRLEVCQKEGYGADEIILMISSSDRHNQLNFRMTHQEAMRERAAIMKRAHALGIRVIGCAGTVYGCPVRGDLTTAEVVSPQPWAAASLGQVHLARLKGEGSRQVVVKIQRPDIEEIITIDLRALRTVGGWLNYYPPIRRRIDIRALMNEFTRILFEEIDYLAEGRNAETFAAHFKDDPRVRVPEVLWTHPTRRVLTLEDVRAIKITDYQAITAAGISRREGAQLLLDTYLKQIFEDGYFHGDPHPGNLFVTPVSQVSLKSDKAEGDWLLTFVDFGMVGRVLCSRPKPTHRRTNIQSISLHRF